MSITICSSSTRSSSRLRAYRFPSPTTPSRPSAKVSTSLRLVSEDINLTSENLGARRLLNVIEKITENIGFMGPDSTQKTYVIDLAFVSKELKDYYTKADLKRYML